MRAMHRFRVDGQCHQLQFGQHYTSQGNASESLCPISAVREAKRHMHFIWSSLCLGSFLASWQMSSAQRGPRTGSSRDMSLLIPSLFKFVSGSHRWLRYMVMLVYVNTANFRVIWAHGWPAWEAILVFPELVLYLHVSHVN